MGLVLRHTLVEITRRMQNMALSKGFLMWHGNVAKRVTARKVEATAKAEAAAAAEAAAREGGGAPAGGQACGDAA